jgi:transporter family protein
VAAEWLLPAAAFVAIEGALGVATKLALRSIGWRELLIWTACSYGVLAFCLIAIAGESVPLGTGAPWAILSGVFASVGLMTFFLALDRGEASKVVPVTAAYPLVTAVLAALVLSEEVSLLRGLGTILVVLGIIQLGRD